MKIIEVIVQIIILEYLIIIIIGKINAISTSKIKKIIVINKNIEFYYYNENVRFYLNYINRSINGI